MTACGQSLAACMPLARHDSVKAVAAVYGINAGSVSRQTQLRGTDDQFWRPFGADGTFLYPDRGVSDHGIGDSWGAVLVRPIRQANQDAC